MHLLPDNPTRQETLEFISKSASYGNLGVFFGAGFSKAVLNDGASEIALSWGDLLKRVAMKMDVEYESINEKGMGYPEIASANKTWNRRKAELSSEIISELKNIAGQHRYYGLGRLIGAGGAGVP